MARPKSIRYSLAVLFFLIVSIIAAKSAYGKSETEIYGAAESFIWKEFNDSGARLLRGFLTGRSFSAQLTAEPEIGREHSLSFRFFKVPQR